MRWYHVHLDFHFKVIVYTGKNQTSAVKYPKFGPMTKCTCLDFGNWKWMTFLKEQLNDFISSLENNKKRDYYYIRDFCKGWSCCSLMNFPSTALFSTGSLNQWADLKNQISPNVNEPFRLLLWSGWNNSLEFRNKGTFTKLDIMSTFKNECVQGDNAANVANSGEKGLLFCMEDRRSNRFGI